MDAADCRLVTGVAEYLFGEVLLFVRFMPADQRSASFRTVIWRSVAEVMAGVLWLMACNDELLGNQLAMLANWSFPTLLMQFGDICHLKTASGNSQRIIFCPLESAPVSVLQ